MRRRSILSWAGFTVLVAALAPDSSVGGPQARPAATDPAPSPRAETIPVRFAVDTRLAVPGEAWRPDGLPDGTQSPFFEEPNRRLAGRRLAADLVAGANRLLAPSLGRSFALAEVSVDAHLVRGIALRRRGRAAEAVKEYEWARDRRPSSAAVHYDLAIALDHLGQSDQALAAYDRAIELDPATPARTRTSPACWRPTSRGHRSTWPWLTSRRASRRRPRPPRARPSPSGPT